MDVPAGLKTCICLDPTSFSLLSKQADHPVTWEEMHVVLVWTCDDDDLFVSWKCLALARQPTWVCWQAAKTGTVLQVGADDTARIQRCSSYGSVWRWQDHPRGFIGRLVLLGIEEWLRNALSKLLARGCNPMAIPRLPRPAQRLCYVT